MRSLHSVVLDIGAVEGVQGKALLLVVKYKATVYTMIVGRDGLLTIAGKRDGVYGYETVQRESAMYERLVSHAITRGICRGIDRAETLESDVAVMIDLGELPERYCRNGHGRG